MQVVRLENVQAQNVARLVEESVAGRFASGVGLKVAVQPEHNALVRSATTAQIREALEVVAQLDSGPGR